MTYPVFLDQIAEYPPDPVSLGDGLQRVIHIRQPSRSLYYHNNNNVGGKLPMFIIYMVLTYT